MVLKLTLRCLVHMGYQCTFGVLQVGLSGNGPKWADGYGWEGAADPGLQQTCLQPKVSLKGTGLSMATCGAGQGEEVAPGARTHHHEAHSI